MFQQEIAVKNINCAKFRSIQPIDGLKIIIAPIKQAQVL
jgi:hypothetical protein